MGCNSSKSCPSSKPQNMNEPFLIENKIGDASKDFNQIAKLSVIEPFSNIITRGNGLIFSNVLLGVRKNTTFFVRLFGSDIVEGSTVALRLEGLKNVATSEASYKISINAALSDAKSKEILKDAKILTDSSKFLTEKELSLLVQNIITLDQKASERVYQLTITLRDEKNPNENFLEIFYNFQVIQDSENAQKSTQLGSIRRVTGNGGPEISQQGMGFEAFEVFQEGVKVGFPLKIKVGSKVRTAIRGIRGMEFKGGKLNLGFSVMVVRADGELVFGILDFFQKGGGASKKLADKLEIEVDMLEALYQQNMNYTFSLRIWDKESGAQIAMQSLFGTL